jgi:adenine-specific DNA-methyltransferase
MMRDRLLQIRKLLSPNGSVWVHCDDSEQAYLKVMMDEVLGRQNFVATVIWEKADSPRMDAQWFSGRHDYLIVYGGSAAVVVNGFAYEPSAAEHYDRVDRSGRPYYLKPLRAMGGQGSTRSARPTLWYSLKAPDGTEVWPIARDGSQGCWRWSRERVEREPDRIAWIDGKRGWQPYYRVYGDAAGRRPPETLWNAADVGSNRTSKNEIRRLFPDAAPFKTPKPERLMERIIHIASSPGDIVLDCFAGSGTTAAVAHKMGRSWVTVEWSAETVETFTRPRIERVVASDAPGGTTETAGWQGGGGFRVLDVAPSMFAEVDGRVWLADWAVDRELAEATAAQLGYDFEADPPFAGRKGRTRLAVVDGLVNGDVVALLAGALAPDEKIVICETAIDPDATPLLRELRRGLADAEDPRLDPRRVPHRAGVAGGRRRAQAGARAGRCVTGVSTDTRLSVDEDAIEAIAARLDLREPNREALRSVAYMVSQHHDVERRPPPFEGVVDAATGVGKTYIIGAGIDYYAERGHRNFAVVTPGRTILEKTIGNFTPGHPKSLLEGMEAEPLVVTSENFATVDHAEPDRVRLYVFTVQSLVRPTGRQGRRTHTFHELLGEAFYAYLRELDDLILFADEHHVYYGPAFLGKRSAT